MKRKTKILIFIISLCSNLLANNMGNDYIINAFWYNIPLSDSVNFKYNNEKLSFYSTLQIYCNILDIPYNIEVTVLSEDGTKVFYKTFLVSKTTTDKTFSLLLLNGTSYKIICPVDYLKQNPNKIIVRIKERKINEHKEFICKYNKLSGQITDFEGNPVNSFINVQPDGFLNEEFNIGIWSDSLGRYDIHLPQRSYSSLYANTENYGISDLETWGWNIILDADISADFKIGNGEIYNMHAWDNNGGGPCFFVSFRPMILLPDENKSNDDTIIINNKGFKLIDYAPDLTIDNVKAFVDNEEFEIISIQKYFETDSLKQALPAYIVQVNKRKNLNFKKQTIRIEFEKIIEYRKVKIKYNGMSIYQCIL